MKRTKATEKQIKKFKFSLDLILQFINKWFTHDENGCYAIETENFRFFAAGDNFISIYYSNSNEKCMRYPTGLINKSDTAFNITQNINENIDYDEILSECFDELSNLIKV